MMVADPCCHLSQLVIVTGIDAHGAYSKVKQYNSTEYQSLLSRPTWNTRAANARTETCNLFRHVLKKDAQTSQVVLVKNLFLTTDVA